MHRTYKAHFGLLRKEINSFSFEKENEVFTKRARELRTGNVVAGSHWGCWLCCFVGPSLWQYKHPQLPMLGALR